MQVYSHLQLLSVKLLLHLPYLQLFLSLLLLLHREFQVNLICIIRLFLLQDHSLLQDYLQCTRLYRHTFLLNQHFRILQLIRTLFKLIVISNNSSNCNNNSPNKSNYRNQNRLQHFNLLLHSKALRISAVAVLTIETVSE